MLLAISEMLSMRGFAVATESNGTRALRLACERDFDVIVSDIRLPGHDGLALARTVGRMPRPPKVILITAYPRWQVYTEATDAGAFIVLTKPLILTKLADAILDACGEGSRP